MRKRSRFQRIKQIQSFRSRKVDIAKYVNDFYLENGVAFISCTVSEINDIISPYSVKDYEWLNESFASYIESNAFYIPEEYPIVVEICGGNFSDSEKEIIENTILDYYALQLGDKQIELDHNITTLISTIVISIIGYMIFFLIKNVFPDESAVMEFSTIIFWTLVWRITDCISERLTLSEEKGYAAQLASVQVRFRKKFVDEEITEKAAEKIITEVFENWEENL